jgi:predicted ATPase
MSFLTWMLGHPERAARIYDAGAAHARVRGHPFDLVWALTFGAQIFGYLREPDEFLGRIKEGDRVAREHSLRYLTECFVPICSGIALIDEGQTAEGVALLERGLAVWEKGGGRINNPYWKSVLAEGRGQLGDLTGALDLIDEAIVQVERPGWGERHHYAEVLRIKGWLRSLKGDLAGAESAYLASLGWARQQEAKSWELRSATSYARLMRDQGRVGEAYELLAPVYRWFTEGFATKDLKDAKALLNELETADARVPAAPA